MAHTNTLQDTLGRRDPDSALPNAHSLKRISWGAVFAGVAIILVIQCAMALLGAGIGLGLVDPVSRETPGAGSFGIGAGIYWVISALVSLVVGGWIAGRLAGIPRDFDGMIHGILAWSVATLLTFYLLTSSIGSVIGGAFGMVGSAAQTATQAVSTAKPDVSGMAGTISERLKQSGVDTDRMKADAQDPAKQQATEQKARETADVSAKIASRASLIGFLVLVLGAAAAAIGGRMGRPHDLGATV